MARITDAMVRGVICTQCGLQLHVIHHIHSLFKLITGIAPILFA